MSQIHPHLVRSDAQHWTFAILKSQLTLFNYRKRWGMIYALATLAGLFSIPGTFASILNSPQLFSQTVAGMVTLPLSSLFIIIGMYVFNDLVDADLDKLNGKKRPIPSGEVSKLQAWIFIISTNSLGIALSLVSSNIFSLLISLSLVSIGIMYSAPRIAFKDKFLVKTISIAVSMIAISWIVYGISNTGWINPLLVSLVSILTICNMSKTLKNLSNKDYVRKQHKKSMPLHLLLQLALALGALLVVI